MAHINGMAFNMYKLAFKLCEPARLFKRQYNHFILAISMGVIMLYTESGRSQPISDTRWFNWILTEFFFWMKLAEEGGGGEVERQWIDYVLIGCKVMVYEWAIRMNRLGIIVSDTYYDYTVGSLFLSRFHSHTVSISV